MDLFGNCKELQFRKKKQSIANKGEEPYFIEKKEEVGSGDFEGKQEFRMLTLSHWLSGGSFSLVGAVAG